MWKFLNSAFCLWLLTTVVGGIGVWSFERYLDKRNKTQALVFRSDRMDLEFEGRIAQYASWVDGIVEKNSKHRDETSFRPCVTNEYLHQSIRILGSPPTGATETDTKSITKPEGCPRMFNLLPIFEEFSKSSLLGLYAERIVIEETLFPGKKVRDPEDCSFYFKRDPTAQAAIDSWENAMNPFLRPEALTGVEIGSDKKLDYKYFHDKVTEYFYSSPRQKDIFHYGDCFRC